MISRIFLISAIIVVIWAIYSVLSSIYRRKKQNHLALNKKNDIHENLISEKKKLKMEPHADKKLMPTNQMMFTDFQFSEQLEHAALEDYRNEYGTGDQVCEKSEIEEYEGGSGNRTRELWNLARRYCNKLRF